MTELNDPEGDPGLLAFLPAVWRHWIVVVVGTLLGGVIAFFVVGRTVPDYLAVARLIVLPSKTAPEQPAANMATYQMLVSSQDSLQQVVKQYALDKPPWSYTPFSLARCCVTISVPASSGVIQIQVRLPAADVASNIANALADRAVERAGELNDSEVVATRDRIKAQLDASTMRLKDASQALVAFQETSGLDVLRKDVEALLGQRARLADLNVQVRVEQARLATLEKELAGQPPTHRTPSAVEIAPETAGNVRIRPEATSPYMNPVYELLQTQVAASRASLAAAEKERGELQARFGTTKAEPPLLTELYAKEAKLAALKAEQDLAHELYTEVAQRYDQAQLQVSLRTAQLQVLDRAVVGATAPVENGRARVLFGGMALGFLLISGAVIIFAYLRERSGVPGPRA